MRRAELSGYSFDFIYWPGHDNVGTNTISRSFCSATTSLESLEELHNLCHAALVRLLHFVESETPHNFSTIWNLSLVGARFVPKSNHSFANCLPGISSKPPICLKDRVLILKDRCHRHSEANVLTIVDQYYRSPFAHTRLDLSAATVIWCSTNVFDFRYALLHPFW